MRVNAFAVVAGRGEPRRHFVEQSQSTEPKVQKKKDKLTSRKFKSGKTLQQALNVTDGDWTKRSGEEMQNICQSLHTFLSKPLEGRLNSLDHQRTLS
jgi:hypothetical protein